MGAYSLVDDARNITLSAATAAAAAAAAVTTVPDVWF